MIVGLEGLVLRKSDTYFLLKTGGITYQVYSFASVLDNVEVGENFSCYTYQHIREKIWELYGFNSWAELDFFNSLLDVSGIGPKVGLSIMELAPLSRLKKAIVLEESKLLSMAKGVGKKTSQKIVLELKDKITLADQDLDSLAEEDSTAEVIAALEGLGYGKYMIRKVVTKLDSSLSLEEKIKKALQELGKNK